MKIENKKPSLINFNDYPSHPKRFGGSDPKETIVMNGSIWMIKLDDEISNDKRSELSDPIRHTVMSEYVSCSLLKRMGYVVQDVRLGTYHNKQAVACKDFCADGIIMNEFEKYQNSEILQISQERFPDIEEVVGAMSRDQYLSKSDAIEVFWDNFVIDSLLGNFDRHTGNWGYVFDIQGNVSAAPIYDCGDTLFPMLSNKGMEVIMTDPGELERRTSGFVRSAFKHDGKRIEYGDYLKNTTNVDCLAAVIRLSKRFSLDLVKETLENVPEISSIRKDFYQTAITGRYEKIIVPAITRAIELLQEDHNIQESITLE